LPKFEPVNGKSWSPRKMMIARQPWRHCVTSLRSAHWLTNSLKLAARCPVSGCWPSCIFRHTVRQWWPLTSTAHTGCQQWRSYWRTDWRINWTVVWVHWQHHSLWRCQLSRRYVFAQDGLEMTKHTFTLRDITSFASARHFWDFCDEALKHIFVIFLLYLYLIFPYGML